MTKQIIDDAKAALLSFADESDKNLPAEIDEFLSDADNVNVFAKFAELQRERAVEQEVYAWEIESPYKTWSFFTVDKDELKAHLDIGWTVINELIIQPPKKG